MDIHFVAKTTVKCLDCKLWYRVGSFETKENIKCPKCSSSNFKSVYDDVSKMTSKEYMKFIEKITEIQRKDMIETSKKLSATYRIGG